MVKLLLPVARHRIRDAAGRSWRFSGTGRARAGVSTTRLAAIILTAMDVIHG
ncbi:hypothetical protein [Bradyrhizobium sp.]|uniref:hypothetical protein n=1 Tax=Bradyrhizobium sp. TaxID=376 RepID=UPI002735E15C|nr:hypothetical protein [Bradyrhizobium sp.]